MKKSIIFLLTIILTFSLFGQTGKPFISNYSPSQYGGNAQIWSIAQDQNGVMYFGSNQNLLIFDGFFWDKVDMGNYSNAIRSIDVDSSGRIYIGSVGEFGYIETKQNGKYKYKSISDLIDSTEKNFTDIWTLHSLGENVYFCANEALFRYNPTSEKPLIRIDSGSSFFLTYKVRNEIFVTVSGKGLLKIDGDSLVKIPLGNEIGPWIMLPYDNDKYLINSGDGLMIYNPKATDKNDILSKKYFNQNEIKKTDEYITEQQPYLGAAYIGNDKYALSTIRNGIVIINKKGEILKKINKNSGLGGQTVHCLFLDNEKQLWAGLSYGISHVEINSPFGYFNEKDGVDGTFYDAFRFGDIFYASSNLGLFYWQKDKFYPVKKLTGENSVQVFMPKNFKFKNKNLYTVSTIYGFLKIINNDVKVLNEIIPSTSLQSRFDSNKVWMASDYDLFSLNLQDELKNYEKIYTFNSLVDVYGQKDKNNLWLITENKPILFNLKTKKITSYKNNKEIENIKFYGCIFINNKTLFFTNNGLYIFNLNKFSPYNKFLDNTTFGKDITQLEKISDNEYWLNYTINDKSKIAILKKNNGKFVFDSIPFKKLPETELFYNDGDSIMWIISSQKLYSYKTYLKNDLSIANKVFIRKIENGDSIIFDGLNYSNWAKNNAMSEFKYNNNDFKIYYTLPTYSNPKNVKYSYKLEGGKKQKWSNWSNLNFKEYTNLHEGKYTFKVKAQNIYGEETDVSEFHFIVLPPWYRSFVAFIFYFLIFILIIWLAIKINSIRMKKENERLDRLVKERTAEINQQKEEIIAQSDNLKEINSLLTQKNEEVNQQNEEIKAQTESLKEANTKIKEKNRYITESIQYAERIQKAILPSEKEFKNTFSDYFILYIPKDVISGDFYWMKKIKDHIIIAAVDCTGHGVPGGFISMLSVSILNEIVRREDVKSPNIALEKMRRLVKLALNQNNIDASQFDGFDVALIEINKNTGILNFSGAYSPLYIVRNKELIVYKSVLNPIGYYPFEKPFKNVEIKLQKDDMIYMFSDGYKDQLNTENRTFNSKKFKKLLQTTANKKATSQKQELLDNFLEWKQNKKQTDDILILGLRW